MSAAEVDPREERLPKYAQRRLDALRRRVRDLEISLEERKPGPEIRVVTQPYADYPKPVGGERASVRFYLDAFDGHRWIDARLEGDALEITGWSGLQIVPHVSNRLTLRSTR